MSFSPKVEQKELRYYKGLYGIYGLHLTNPQQHWGRGSTGGGSVGGSVDGRGNRGLYGLYLL